MSQWRKINNGIFPSGEQAPQPKNEVEKIADKAREIAQVQPGVEVHPDMINGQPGLRIKIGF